MSANENLTRVAIAFMKITTHTLLHERSLEFN